MQPNDGQKIVIWGASRGLGAAIAQRISGRLAGNSLEFVLIARSQSNLDSLARNLEGNKDLRIHTKIADLSDPNAFEKLVPFLKDFNPHRHFYCAGGGPYGNFGNKSWKDHQWSLQVTFLVPAQLLHFCLQQKSELQVEQCIFVGSAICESQPDPHASSYAASKHALKGLISSVQKESPTLDVRLYSPGYMDTQLLPTNSWPRQNGRVEDPLKVAEDLVKWAFDDTARCTHRVFDPKQNF